MAKKQISVQGVTQNITSVSCNHPNEPNAKTNKCISKCVDCDYIHYFSKIKKIILCLKINFVNLSHFRVYGF